MSDLNIPYVKTGNKYMGINLEELPNECFVKAEMVIGVVTFVVDSYTQRKQNPGNKDDCVVTNIYGESLRISKANLINNFVRLSNRPIKMSTIVGGKEYKGVFSMGNRFKKPKYSSEDIEGESNADTVKEFMGVDKAREFLAVCIPANCKVFTEGDWQSGDCYYITHPDMDNGNRFVRLSKTEFNKMFRVIPDNDLAKKLSNCGEGSTLFENAINKFVEKKNKENAYQQRKIVRNRVTNSIDSEIEKGSSAQKVAMDKAMSMAERAHGGNKGKPLQRSGLKTSQAQTVEQSNDTDDDDFEFDFDFDSDDSGGNDRKFSWK